MYIAVAVTRKQRRANRRNAKRSTGPKSDRGKAVVSCNATSHEVYSQQKMDSQFLGNDRGGGNDESSGDVIRSGNDERSGDDRRGGDDGMSVNARDIIIDSPYFKEEISEYNFLLNSLTEELHPKGIFQKMLVQKIANCLWRSRRAVIAETAQINRQLASAARTIDDGDTPQSIFDERDLPSYPFRNASERTASLSGRELIPSDSFCHNIMRYEMRLDRQLTRAYKLLRHLQIMDQCVGEPVVMNDDGRVMKPTINDGPPGCQERKAPDLRASASPPDNGSVRGGACSK